jgi:hypothetical protein
MPERAKVTSFEAIDAFRAHLIVFLSKARPALEEVAADVMRTRLWLENDQRTYWENQYRLRQKALERAQEALFSAKISNLRTEGSVEQLAFHRARRALDDAEQKLRIIKKWNREFDGHVQPLVKQTEKLHTFLSADLPQAVAHLHNILDTLAAYAEAKAPSMAPAGSSSAPATAAPETTPEPPKP